MKLPAQKNDASASRGEVNRCESHIQLCKRIGRMTLIAGRQVIPVGPGTATIAAVQGGSPVWLTASNSSTPLTVKALVANLSIQPDAGGNTLLTVEGNTNRPYILQATADLGATNWTPVVTISNLPAPTLQFSAPATNAAQFYRLQRPVYSGFGN